MSMDAAGRKGAFEKCWLWFEEKKKVNPSLPHVSLQVPPDHWPRQKRTKRVISGAQSKSLERSRKSGQNPGKSEIKKNGRATIPANPFSCFQGSIQVAAPRSQLPPQVWD